jgi:transposase InsO family protein
MVSPSGRRRAVEHLQEYRGLSERHACRVVGQARSTQRYMPTLPDRDRTLRNRVVELAKQHPRYGYRRVTAMLKREGRQVNRKRVQRLWRLEGLWVPQVQKKRRRLGKGKNGCDRLRPQWVHHIWSYDFVFDETEDGRQLKWLSVIDEYSRFNLALEVERHFRGEEVVAILKRLFEEYGPPDYLRSDNGSEFIAKVVRQWLDEQGVKTLYIDPGAPWENGYTESFNGSLRDELLNREVFAHLLEAKLLAMEFRGEYNGHRPHSSLGYQTPAEFLAQKLANRSRAANRENDSLGSPRIEDLVLGRGRSTPELVIGLS